MYNVHRYIDTPKEIEKKVGNRCNLLLAKRYYNFRSWVFTDWDWDWENEVKWGESRRGKKTKTMNNFLPHSNIRKTSPFLPFIFPRFALESYFIFFCAKYNDLVPIILFLLLPIQQKNEMNAREWGIHSLRIHERPVLILSWNNILNRYNEGWKGRVVQGES